MKDDIHQLKEQVNKWLENPLESGIDDAPHRSEALLAELQQTLQSSPNSSKSGKWQNGHWPQTL